MSILQVDWIFGTELSLSNVRACVPSEGFVRLFHFHGWQGCCLSCYFTVASDEIQQ